MKASPPISIRLALPSLLSAATALLFMSDSALASPAADNNTWYAHESGITTTINSISASGNYLVAAATGGRLIEFKNGTWQAVPGASAYLATNPFGTAIPDSLNLRAAAAGDGVFWFGAFASQANDARHTSDGFETISRGTTARVVSVNSFGSSVIMGLNNGRVTIVTNAASESPFRTVSTLTGHGNRSVQAVGGFSNSNVWASMGNSDLGYTVFRTTSASSSVVPWTEHVLPDYALSLQIQAIGVPDDTSAYFAASGTSAGQGGLLYRWTSGGGFDDSALFTFDLADSFRIRSIYVQDEENIWLTGDGGNLWYYNGDSASKINLGTTASLYSITASTDGIWVAGTNGEIYSTIAPIPEPGTLTLIFIAGAAVIGYSRRFPKLNR